MTTYSLVQPAETAWPIRTAFARRRASASPCGLEVLAHARRDGGPVHRFGQQRVDEGTVGLGQAAERWSRGCSGPALLGVFIIAVAALTPSSGLAITPYTPPPDLSEAPEAKAERLRKMAQIPLVQVEVEFGVDQRFTPSLSYRLNRCYFEAIVRRSFQHADILPVGRRIRVHSDCKKEGQSQVVEIRPGVRVDIISGPDERDLVQGSLLQMRLLPAYGPIDGFDKIGPVTVLRALSDTPIDDSAGEAHRASHLNDYNLLDNQNRPTGSGNPPEFPLKDVVITYKDSSRPARLFRASFQGRTWRVRAEELTEAGSKLPAVIDDAFAQTEAWIWNKTATYAVQMTDWRTRFGKVVRYWKPISEKQGTDNIAGLPCTEYHIRSEVPTLEPAQVCMTSDGVVLRRSYPDGHRTEAVSVEYEPVSRDQVTVPQSYRAQTP